MSRISTGPTAGIDAAIARTRQQVELVKEYRTRLVADVVTGKLDVREAATQLPDEPDSQDSAPESDPFTSNSDQDLYNSIEADDKHLIEAPN